MASDGRGPRPLAAYEAEERNKVSSFYATHQGVPMQYLGLPGYPGHSWQGQGGCYPALPPVPMQSQSCCYPAGPPQATWGPAPGGYPVQPAPVGRPWGSGMGMTGGYPHAPVDERYFGAGAIRAPNGIVHTSK